ncbi:MAG TPA: 30S ribosomal protein S6, partial [Dehalococcoidia bacterium]|nr:30S ribosomal protein S6 [Dehalococcoidia bacterium]
MTSQRTRDYEVVMVLSPESTEDEAKSTVNRITEIITQQGGEITHEENWGVRRLAYPIKRFVEGNYFLARFRLESDGVLELNQTLNAAQDVLRHLVMRMDKDALAALEAKTALEARRKAEAEARAERDAREAEEARERAEAAEAQAEAAPAAETPVAEAEEVAEALEPVAEEPVAEDEAPVAETEEPEEVAEEPGPETEEPVA